MRTTARVHDNSYHLGPLVPFSWCGMHLFLSRQVLTPATRSMVQFPPQSHCPSHQRLSASWRWGKEKAIVMLAEGSFDVKSCSELWWKSKNAYSNLLIQITFVTEIKDLLKNQYNIEPANLSTLRIAYCWCPFRMASVHTCLRGSKKVMGLLRFHSNSGRDYNRIEKK